MEITLIVALGSVALIVIFGLSLLLRSSLENKAPRPQRVPEERNRGVPRRAQAVRNRGARLRGNVAQEESNDEDAEDVSLSDEKVGAKKRAKLEAKAEKKAQREQEQQSREEKKKKEQLAEEERRKAEEKEKEDEKKREEAERKAREEKERQEHEEYLKMKEAFSIEEEGYEENETEQQNLLQEFVAYIKQNKVIVIEDLAAHFKLKTQATIDRIQDLQKDGILSGVIDDRGKFIYISQQELEAVAKFIKQRGRVSIAELVDNSNSLINLNSGHLLAN